MKMTHLAMSLVACGTFALLTGCGGGSASQDAAGTIMAAKRTTTYASEPAAVAPEAAPEAATTDAAVEAAKAGADGDASSAAAAANAVGATGNGKREGGPKKRR